MFSLAYVLLPMTDRSPGEAIRESLARFQRGSTGDFPEDWLQFHDETAHVEELYRAKFAFITEDVGLRIEGGESWYLNGVAIREEMARRGIDRWPVCFADIECDLGRFVDRFLTPLARHPVTGGFGQWLNPLGRWDWWELGGRFHGQITGQVGRSARHRSSISSGPSKGRALLDRLEDAVGSALGQDPIEEILVAADDNVELVAKLRDDLTRNPAQILPGAVLLPPGSADDALRWIGNWPKISPVEAITLLNISPNAPWPRVVEAVYDRFPDHWAAGVAFHH